ncbi:MAG: sulfatase-like hydrolase/transferase [Planctomycetaceae bacterium]
MLQITPNLPRFLNALVSVLLMTAVCVDADEAIGDERTGLRPNLLVILADDLGNGDLSCCGSTDLKTPHIDGLFRDGMRMARFRANCPVCSPTRAALLSGRYQERVGVPGVIRTRPEDNWGWLNPDAVLLPKVAQQHGYHTAIIGKWHLGLQAPNIPTQRGFDHFHGFLGDMMDDYYNHSRHDINYMFHDETEIDPEGHATDLFTSWAVDYLNSRKEQSQPFLLYLAYNAPHTPIQPPDEWLQKVKAREPGISEKRAKLVALIEHMDDGVGQILKALEVNGQRDNTMIVFTSDNGGQLDVGANNGDIRDGKQSMYEGGLRVPTAVVWKDHVKAGSRSELAAMSMDLLPTFFAAAGIPLPGNLDGASFLPALLGQDQPPLRQQLFFCRREGGLNYGGKTIEAVIDWPWKLLQNSPFAPLELYNLESDPEEKVNLAAQHRPHLVRLNAALRQQMQEGGRVPWQAPE